MSKTENLLTDQQRQRLEAAARAAMLRVIREQALPVRLGQRRTACFGPDVEKIVVQVVPPGGITAATTLRAPSDVEKIVVQIVPPEHIGAEGTTEKLSE